MTTVKDIITEWLVAHGADGLCNDDCACPVADLASCGSFYMDCMAARDTGARDGYDHCFEPIEDETDRRDGIGLGK